MAGGPPRMASHGDRRRSLGESRLPSEGTFWPSWVPFEMLMLGNTAAGDPPPTVIEARGLSKRYESIVAVDNVSFSVQRGEIFGLLGPNGAGKSTTLEMLEGLREIDSGSAVVLGADIATHAVAVKQRIGVQLQATALPDSGVATRR
jgi:ABC-type glutathione transport system ATPase component